MKIALLGHKGIILSAGRLGCCKADTVERRLYGHSGKLAKLDLLGSKKIGPQKMIFSAKLTSHDDWHQRVVFICDHLTTSQVAI